MAKKLRFERGYTPEQLLAYKGDNLVASIRSLSGEKAAEYDVSGFINGRLKGVGILPDKKSAIKKVREVWGP